MVIVGLIVCAVQNLTHPGAVRRPFHLREDSNKDQVLRERGWIYVCVSVKDGEILYFVVWIIESPQGPVCRKRQDCAIRTGILVRQAH